MLPNKKKLSFLPILLLLAVFTTDMQGQNYALFNKDRYMNYTKQDTAEADSIYYFAKIDSVVFDGIDSIFYFNHPLDTVTDGSCFAVNGIRCFRQGRECNFINYSSTNIGAVRPGKHMPNIIFLNVLANKNTIAVFIKK